MCSWDRANRLALEILLSGRLLICDSLDWSIAGTISYEGSSKTDVKQKPFRLF